MATLNEILLGIAQDLNDAAPGREFRLYPRDQLIRWWNDALCALCSLRPRLFSTTKVIELVPGAEQKIEGCTLISSVRGQVNARGEVISTVRPVSDKALLAWTKPACPLPAANAYRATGFRYDRANRDTFYIDPPVPPGQKVSVQVVCSLCPASLTMSDLDAEIDVTCYQLLMAKHYIYQMAYAMESDQTNFALAQYHGNIWSAYLSGNARAEAAYNKSADTAVAAQQSTQAQAAGGT